MVASFNPLSTGHAPVKHDKNLFRIAVSIPYLRVTHKAECRRVNPAGHVSIPYLRVTHRALPLGAAEAGGFQSPIYGSRTVMFFSFRLKCFPVSIPYLRVTHAPRQHHANTFRWFQSPIYGSRTLATDT